MIILNIAYNQVLPDDISIDMFKIANYDEIKECFKGYIDMK